MNIADNPALSSMRPMQKEDIDAVMEIELASYDFPWKENIYQDCLKVGYICLIMEYKQKIIGYGIMSAAVGEAHILNLCIQESFRRYGLGKVLLNHLLELSKIRKATTIFLEVRTSNIAAYRLYENEGFSEIGLRQNYYPAINDTKSSTTDGREDAIIMAKEIV